MKNGTSTSISADNHTYSVIDINYKQLTPERSIII